MGEMADYALDQLLNQDELESSYQDFDEACEAGVEELLYDEFGCRYLPVFPSAIRKYVKPRGSGPCPKCGAPTAKRTNKTTKAQFWGCSQFPECNGNRDA